MRKETFDWIKTNFKPYKQHLVLFMGLFRSLFFLKYRLKSRIESIFSRKKESFVRYSVVSACYNVENYVDDFLISLLNQTVDFQHNIQVILVDDGSTDATLNRLKAWQTRYPQNIIVLTQKNAGQASARNLGLKYVKNEWVTFTDPDDFLSARSFEYVDNLIGKHENLILVSLNLIPYYEGALGFIDNHPLKFRYQGGTRIVTVEDLNNEVILSASSSFFRLESIQENQIQFDCQCRPNFEDALFLQTYLLPYRKKQVAFLSEAKYFYRKRKDGSSTLDNSLQDKKHYKDVLSFGYLALLKQYKHQLGDIPKNIQKLIVYDTHWYFDKTRSPVCLSYEENEHFWSLMHDIFDFIEPETIEDSELLGVNCTLQQALLREFKPHYEPTSRVAFVDRYDPVKGELLLRYSIKQETDELLLKSGSEIVKAHQQKIVVDRYYRKDFYQEKIGWFSLKKLNKKSITGTIGSIKILFSYEGETAQILSMEDFARAYLKEVKDAHYAKAWLLFDREGVAGDNAEHFYRYLMLHHLEQDIYFVLKRSSSDWKRLKGEGFRLIRYGSFLHRKALKSCQCLISSHVDDPMVTAEIWKNTPYVFLQHGVTIHDVSKWLNRKKITLFITSTRDEYQSLVANKTPYYLTPNEVVLTGMPRYDSLVNSENKPKKMILIMPTWRSSLFDMQTGKIRKGSENSLYFRRWAEFLNSQQLKDLANSFGYEIVFFPHEKVRRVERFFDIPEYIQKPKTKTIQMLLCQASVLITDYSSIAFDFAYLKKPIIYYQFDRGEIFEVGTHTYSKGYFDYTEQGFGEVVLTDVKLYNCLYSVLKGNCELAASFQKRVEETFEYTDSANCARVYETIRERLNV